MNALLEPKLVEKPWGCDQLPAPFAAPAGKRIGEIWFEPPPALETLLAKYLFTSEALSVQVHPDDARAPAGTRGKEECWLILHADPDAKLAIGFDEEISADALRAAAQDGSIEELLTWHRVKAGDFFYLPAGTVHAIGAGLTIAELQQNSDVTYRLYDYGRPRELHLEEGLRVADRGRYDGGNHRHVAAGESAILVDGPHFRLAHVSGAPAEPVRAAFAKPLMILPLDGIVHMESGARVEPGGCGWAEDIREARFEEDSRSLLLTTAG